MAEARGTSFPVVRDYVCLALAAFLVVYAAFRVHDNTTLGVFFGTALLLAGLAPARRLDEYLRRGDDS